MKTVLFATSALVAFAGAAAAEVAVSGDARIGLRYDDSLAYAFDSDGDGIDDSIGTRDGWNTVSRARVIFTMTGETDSGLSFGASFRADQASNANRGSNSSNTEGTVFLSGTYGKLTAGDIDSALESAVGDLPEIGVSGLNYYNEMQYTSSEFDSDLYEQAGLIYEYKIGDASLYASFMDQFVGNTGETIDDLAGDNSWALGAGYTLGNYTFGIGYENAGVFVDPVGYTYLNQSYSNSLFVADTLYSNDNTTWGISGGTSWQGITFKAIYLTTSADGELGPDSISADDYDVKQYGIGAEYKMANGVQVAGFYRKIDGDALVVGGVAFDNEADIYGIGAGYDLGGGAVVKAGIAHIEGTSPFYGDAAGDFDRTVADFGVRLNF